MVEEDRQRFRPQATANKRRAESNAKPRAPPPFVHFA
jgi:hypothetical protein